MVDDAPTPSDGTAPPAATPIERLLSLLAKAAEGSRELDGMCWCLANGYEFIQWDGAGCVYRVNVGYRHRAADEIKPYTTSLDAALTLVPDGCTVYMTRPNYSADAPGNQLAYACAAPLGLGGPQYAKKRAHLSAHHRSLPLALCIAALKARSAK